MAEIKLDQKARDSLIREGFKLPAIYNSVISDSSQFEGPLFVNGGVIYDSRLQVGAFCSIAGAKMGNVTFGRYCAVAENVAIGMHEHPTDWLTISRISHVPEMHDWKNILARVEPRRGEFIRTPFHGSNPETVIGNDVWIGYGSYIRAGVKIGDGAIIAARSIVTRDVPAYSIVAGSPAKILKMRYPNDVIDLAERVQWWQYCLLDIQTDMSDPRTALETIERLHLEGSIHPYYGEVLTPEKIMGPRH